MKKNVLLTLLIIGSLFFSSCKVSKEYVQYISKKEDIITPTTKKVLAFITDDVKVNEFKKTFDKNYTTIKDFRTSYLTDFKKKSDEDILFSEVLLDANSLKFDNLNTENIDYVIHFSNIDINSRVEWIQTGGMGMNGGMGGMQSSTSIEYCVITVKVEVYDAKTEKEILDFVAIGEKSVFMFNFTKTLQDTKARTITHIINYLKSGRTTYTKY